MSVSYIIYTVECAADIPSLVARHLAEQHTIAKDSILNPFARFTSPKENLQESLAESLAKNRYLQELEGPVLSVLFYPDSWDAAS